MGYSRRTDALKREIARAQAILAMARQADGGGPRMAELFHVRAELTFTVNGRCFYLLPNWDTRTMDGSPARPEGCAESTGPSPHAKDRATEVALWRRRSS